MAHVVRSIAVAEAHRVHWSTYLPALKASTMLIAALDAIRDIDAFDGIMSALERRTEGESTQSRVDRGIAETARILEERHGY